MKYVKLFEQFISHIPDAVNEASKDVNDEMKGNPALAKKMIKYAAEENDDDFQWSYTVQTGPPDWDGPLMSFNTMNAINTLMGVNPEDGATDFGVNVQRNGTVEWFYGDSDGAGFGEDGDPLKFNPDGKLSAAIKTVMKAQKLAKAAHAKAKKEDK